MTRTSTAAAAVISVLLLMLFSPDLGLWFAELLGIPDHPATR